MHSSDSLPETVGSTSSQPASTYRKRFLFFQRPVSLGMIIAIIVGVGILRGWLLEGIVVEGRSMYPTLRDKERLLVMKKHFSDTSRPTRGTIIIFSAPGDDHTLVKRVIGLPGERLDVQGTHVYINGALLAEPYAHSQDDDMQSVQVPSGQVFVMGDNRDNSEDSRDFGPIDLDTARGKATFVMWPITDAKRL